mgnify:CR=1 FL=1
MRRTVGLQLPAGNPYGLGALWAYNGWNEVTFVAGEVKDPWGNTKAGFETSTTLNRKDYGIVWNQAVDNGGVILGDDVTIEINLETQKQAPKAAAAGK